MFGSTNNNYYSRSQAPRTNANCVSFGESANDTARLMVGDVPNDSTFGDTQGPGNRRVSSPYDVEDNFNFAGDGTFTTNTFSVTFEGLTAEFGDRLASAQALNTTASGADLDFQASELVTQMWSVPPFLNATRVEVGNAKAVLRGSMFSFADLIVYVGDFNTLSGSFVIDGFATSFNSTTKNAIQLGDVTNVYTTQKENGISAVTVMVNSASSLKPSTLGFQNLNVTVGSHIISTFGDFSFKGASLEINSCGDNGYSGGDGNGTSGVLILLLILIAGLCGCGVVFFMYQKKRKPFIQNSGWNGNQNYMNNQTYNNTSNYGYQSPTEFNGGQIPQSAPQTIYSGYQNQFDFTNEPHANQFPPPIHNVNDASEDSLLRSNQFYDIFPVDSPAALAEAVRTATLPNSMLLSSSKYTMMEPRLHSAFPYHGRQPFIKIGAMDHYNGVQTVEFETNQDVSIQSNQPLLPHQDLLRGFENDQCYYEVKIKHMDSFAPVTIAFGYASIPYPSFRLPGWDRNSIGFHSDDGAVFVNDVDYGTPSGHGKLKVGDVVGAGYYVVKNGDTIVCKFYFTVNGERLRQKYSDSSFEPAKIYPTVGSDSNCTLELSFGNVNKAFFPM
jgi:hypothetical protein